jgi:hypothetical protein
MSERSRGDASDIDGQTDRSNGAFGKSDIEGKVARVAARKRRRDRASNQREHMSQRGQRTSFNSLRANDRVSAYERNGARGTRDIEGKAARVAASECGQRASFNSFHRQAAGNRGRA